MPNVFPDDILARIRVLKAEVDALTAIVSDSRIDIGPLSEPPNPAQNTMRLYVLDNAGTTELHALDFDGNDYTLAP